MAHRYQPLNHAETRLLRLLPGLVSDQLVCHLETVKLQIPCHIRYEALSYVWGSRGELQNIQVIPAPGSGPPSPAEDQVYYDATEYTFSRD